jgi:hypothetical protein
MEVIFFLSIKKGSKDREATPPKYQIREAQFYPFVVLFSTNYCEEIRDYFLDARVPD